MVISSAWEYGERTGKLRRDLIERVGLEDADTLLSGVSREAEVLASLGPVLGLEKVARGEMDRETYLERWGHRGPEESEMSAPRPAEDPRWLDMQLSALRSSPIEVQALLARQRERFDESWARFCRKYPGKTRAYQRRLAKVSEAARVREAVRSEQVRLIWIARVWALCAGDITGLGEGIFHLTKDEVVDLLKGKGAPVHTIPARMETYGKYQKLPPYPVIIRGRFDPIQWARDPNRRTDFFDPAGVIARIEANAERKDPSRRTKVFGAPGSPGVVEGVVHRIDNPDGAHQLRPGEILVTAQTNIGWSHFFPLAKAIVTDVGAALSHAAIVAREMGIPAVVNCGDATMRLKTGDRVRVDGGQGVVEILESKNGAR
jgi:pyruvate,water dikinase